MTVKANGTDAKDVAVHFFDAVGVEINKNKISRTIVQVKKLLEKGYKKDDIISCIDDAVVRNPNIYSFGYIDCVVDEFISKKLNNNAYEEISAGMDEELKQLRSEVVEDFESTSRNRSKISRFGIKSGFGEKHNFDMLK